jgi:hypothetical protein
MSDPENAGPLGDPEDPSGMKQDLGHAHVS